MAEYLREKVGQKKTIATCLLIVLGVIGIAFP